MSADSRRQRTCCGSCCTLLVSLGFVVLIYWAIFQPHQIRATVDTATLSDLTVSNTSSPATVSYHVTINLTLYNPSKRVGIYYDTLTARLLYGGALLSAAPAAAVAVAPAEFYQRRKAAQIVGIVFDGGKDGGVALPDGLAAELETEAAAGRTLSLDLDLALRVRYVFGSVKIRQKPRVWCALAVPLPTAPGGVGVLGSGGRCSVKY